MDIMKATDINKSVDIQSKYSKSSERTNVEGSYVESNSMDDA